MRLPDDDLPAWAAYYASKGLHVFPLKDASKHPLYTGSFKSATTDAAQVKAWWGNVPGANIGFAPGPSGFLVIDEDGPEGVESATALGLHNEPTTVAKSGRAKGGFHRFYRHPGGHIGNMRLRDGLDVRADSGYTLLPPSVHPDTATVYMWSERGPVAVLPPQALEAIRRMTTRVTAARANEETACNPDELGKALAYVECLSPQRAENYDEWVQVGMALRSVGDHPALLQAWDNWSQLSSKWEPGITAHKWGTFTADGVTMGSLVLWARQDSGNILLPPPLQVAL